MVVLPMGAAFILATSTTATRVAAADHTPAPSGTSQCSHSSRFARSVMRLDLAMQSKSPATHSRLAGSTGPFGRFLPRLGRGTAPLLTLVGVPGLFSPDHHATPTH
jgi:hypothetical protein